MKSRKLLKWLLLAIVLVIAVFGFNYCNKSFPIISGYYAKFMASEIFVSGRQQEQIQKEDLSSFPFNLASCTVSYMDSSVSVSVFGFARRKAIYRSGLGCTLINELSEDSVRRQSFVIPKHLLRTVTRSCGL